MKRNESKNRKNGIHSHERRLKVRKEEKKVKQGK